MSCQRSMDESAVGRIPQAQHASVAGTGHERRLTGTGYHRQ